MLYCWSLQAIERGIFFETCYAVAIRDTTMRRYTIANALSLMEVCKGKVCCPILHINTFKMCQASSEITFFSHRIS